MLRTLCLLAVLASAAVAAPVPKAKVEPVDVGSMHARVAQAVAKDNWSDDDAKLVEQTVTALLARMTKAANTDEWKLPVAVNGLERKGVKDVKGTSRNALIVGADVDAVTCSDCVIVAGGAVRTTRLTNCVVVARTVHCTFAENTVVIAEEYARAMSWGLAEKSGCVVVAGKRVGAVNICGGLFHVLAPDPKCHADDADADPKDRRPVLLTVASDATFLLDAAAPPTGDKTCKRIELKTAIAK